MDWNFSFDNHSRINVGSRMGVHEPATPAPPAPTPEPSPASNNATFGMSHQYQYQPVTAGARSHQQAARNPWADDPSTPHPWSLPQPFAMCHIVYPSTYPAVFLPAPAAMHYPGQSNVQFYVSQPAAEPVSVNIPQAAPANHGHGSANNAHAHHSSPNPIQMVPQMPSPNQQLYCRELDGSYTLQTVNKIMQDLQPGYWKESKSGFPYWVRTVKA